MTDVRCPICNETVAGEGELDLSINLQEHMGMVHELKGLCNLEGARAISDLGSENWDKIRKEDESPLSYEDEAIKESHGPLERRLPGEDVPQSVRCPFCGEVVRGYAYDDFSYRLAWHVSLAHAVKVKWTGKG